LAEFLSVNEALRRMLDQFSPLSAETIPISQSNQRALSKPVLATFDFPPFTNSSMDGYAVRAADLNSATPNAPVLLRVVANIPAGAVPGSQLQSGQAARIMTGAPIPDGADAVVPVENTRLAPAADAILIAEQAAPGQYIRPRGSDLKAHDLILPAGRALQPQDIGMLATLGLAEISVHRRPRVCLFSSGDELIMPGQPLAPGQVYDANRFFLDGLMSAVGAEVIHLGTAHDDPQDITRILSGAQSAGADLIVTSAGVSVGAYDFVRQVIEENGHLDFWKVNMRPGKPLAFGSFRGIPLVGLPGNPVSAYVGCTLFVLPILRKLSGLTHQTMKSVRVQLNENIESDGRESYLRARIENQDGKLFASLPHHQGSGNLFSLVLANALLIIPSGVKSLSAGSEAEALLMGGLEA